MIFFPSTILVKVKLANQENDSREPVISENEGDDEEGHSEEDGHSSDQVDEVLDFPGDRGHSCVQSRGQVGDSTHHLQI